MEFLTTGGTGPARFDCPALVTDPLTGGDGGARGGGMIVGGT